MLKPKTLLFICIIAAIVAAPGFSQNEDQKPAAVEETRYYHLDFTVKELEGGKVVNSRSYTAMISTQRNDVCLIKTGDKIPVPTDKGQWTFIDVGVNIECRSLKLVGTQLAMNVSVDISSVASESNVSPPLVRQTKWNSTVLLSPKKQVTVFSSDAISMKRQTQLDVTATPVP